MVVKETFRLHPGNALLVRECMKHSRIDGFDIYPKTTVLINAWATGRDPKYWQNREKFLPERFKDSSIDFSGSQNFEYLPFGGGRRGCPGMNMAIVLIELVLANILYDFEWKLPEGLNKEDLNMEESPGLTIHKKYPLELAFWSHSSKRIRNNCKREKNVILKASAIRSPAEDKGQPSEVSLKTDSSLRAATNFYNLQTKPRSRFSPLI
ncbi:cytochrome P450 71A1-like [Papaver somniferum]|uniref:cytochrome P450 71A1-like n=1 Tax=Papaver somniferum TaxID=3469 RepID=UPI000E6F4D90|nr:cytochrome P450 71A1-like [Papaver somniferum]